MRKFLIIIFILFFCHIDMVNAEKFDITSDQVILYNLNDNSILYEQNSDEKTMVASLTKIMTTIVAIENIANLNEEVVVPKEALKGIEDYTQVGFRAGNKVTYLDLLYGTMLPSGADAVNVLAINISGSVNGFVELMNKKVQELNLENTHFDNPIGMDSEENYSTASDMSKILLYSLQNPTFKEVFSAREYTISSLNKKLKSTLIGYSSSYGLDITEITGAKSGFTDGAGLCLASTALIDDVSYLLITMGADTKNRSNAVRDTLEIYDYYSSTYSYKTVLEKEQKLKTLSVKWGKTTSYDIVAKENLELYLSNDIRVYRIKYVYEGVEELNYQIKKGDKLGIISVMYEGDVLTTFDVFLDKELEYYHPVIYAVIVISAFIMLLSLKIMISSCRKIKEKTVKKKKNSSKVKNKKK